MNGNEWSGQRVAGFAGVGFFLCIVALFAIGGDTPTFGESAPDVRAYFVDSDTQVHLTTWLAGVIFVVCLLPFASGLRDRLASAEGGNEPAWSRLSYSGAVVTAAVGVIGVVFWEVLSQGVAEGASDGVVQALARLDSVVFLSALPWAMALFTAAASVAILRHGAAARGLGWLGIAATLLLLIGTLWVFGEDDEGAFAFIAFGGFPVTGLWVLSLSVSMLRDRTRDPVPSAR